MENLTTDFNDLFNPHVDTRKPAKAPSLEYKPAAKNGKNNVYQSVVRFITWWGKPNQSIAEKWTCYLVDPVSGKGKYVDCPSSIGEKSPLLETYFKLKKSDNVAVQSKALIFSRRQVYTALVQVIKDDHNKEMEGKILSWTFGKKIYDKIDAELNPPFGEPSNPFDLLNGKLFGVYVTLVSGFNNYDNCKFYNQAQPLIMMNEDGTKTVIGPDTDKMLVLDYLKTKSPDLNKYMYKEWDTDTHTYVNQVIAAVMGKATAPSTTAEVLNHQVSTGITATTISADAIAMDNTLPDMSELDMPQTSYEPMDNLGNIDDILANI